MKEQWKLEVLLIYFNFLTIIFINFGSGFITTGSIGSNLRERRSIKNIIPEDYDINVFPPNEMPMKVSYSALVMGVEDIREIEEDISIEMNIRISWKDSRLAPLVRSLQNLSTVTTMSKRRLQQYILLQPSIINQIWVPDVYIDHLKDVDQPAVLSKPSSLRIHSDCTLRYSTRVTIIVSCPMDFHYYPADIQRCDVELKSYGYTEDKMILNWRDTFGANFAYPMEPHNYYLSLGNLNKFRSETLTGRKYSGLRFTVVLQRKLSFHIIQTFLPSILLVIVSWLSFLINIDTVPARTAVIMTCLLTLISMFSSVRQSTPNVSYVKALDIWMVVCVFFVFSTLVEFTVALKIKGMKLKPRKTLHLIPKSTLIVEEVEVGNELISTKVMVPEEKSLPIPPPFTPPNVRTRNEEIVETMETVSSLVIPLVFILFNCIYWPWLIFSSEYLEVETQESIL